MSRQTTKMNAMNNLLLLSMCLCLLVLGSCQGPRTVTLAEPEIDRSFQIAFTESRVQLIKAYAEKHYGKYYQEKYGSPEFPGLEIDPKVIVVHYTAGTTLQGAFDTFAPETLGGRPDLTPAGAVNVGIQFIVDYDGIIYQVQPDNYFGRHVIGLNHSAIGFENIGSGDITKAGLDGEAQEDNRLTLAQLKANVALIRYLTRKYPGIEILIGHSEYRQLEEPSHPGHALFYERDPEYRTEKSDPGPNFMRALRTELSDVLEPGKGGQVFSVMTDDSSAGAVAPTLMLDIRLRMIPKIAPWSQSWSPGGSDAHRLGKAMVP